MRSLSLSLIAVAGLGFLVGCGSGSSPAGAPSNVPPDDTLGQLSASQQASLCDYVANVQGGYGRSMTCPGGDTQTTDQSQSYCLANFGGVAFACPTLTVGDAENCAAACATDLCAVDTAAACAAVRNCANQTFDAGT
jgi:hypothetical protein